MDIENQVRDLFFSNILGGGFYHSSDEIMVDAAHANVEFPYSSFVLASIKVEEWSTPFRGSPGDRNRADAMDLFFILRNVFQEELTFDGSVCQAANYRGKLVCILNSDIEPHQWLETLKAKALHGSEFLDENFDIEISVAFSRVCSDPTDLYRRYIDTEDVHEYIAAINEDLQVVCYDDLTEHGMPQEQENLNYVELQTSLRNCLRRFDTDGARFATSELISKEFYDSPPTIQIFRFRIYGLVNALLFILEDLRPIMGEEEYVKLNVGPRLTEATSLSSILTEVEGIYTQLDEYSQGHSNDNQPKWIPKIREYVDHNYSDVNVTVSSTANHFNMTPSYCTRAFKRYIGISLFDYIQKRRIEAAKQLLNQNMSLADVAEAVGFSSSLTMNRAFKRYEGISPGKFKTY